MNCRWASIHVPLHDFGRPQETERVEIVAEGERSQPFLALDDIPNSHSAVSMI